MQALIVAALLSLLTWTSVAWAQENSDVRLIVDVSGSMKHNDPNQLSASGLELMVTLLPSGVRSGLWTFGSEVANPLPASLVDNQWRRRALAQKPALTDYQQYTDIEQAIEETAMASPASGTRHLILLTDGVIDVPAGGGNKQARDAASRQRLLTKVTPRLAERGVIIHTIAFSSQVDLSLLESMARNTGGLTAVAETPEALLRAFLDVLANIFPANQVPLDDQRFRIDERIDAFSALLFHGPDAPPLTLISPEGKRYTAKNHPGTIHWQTQDRFDVINVPEPATGEWRIEGELGEESRINIESSLVLRTGELPTTLYLGFETPLAAWLDERGERYEPESPQALKLRAVLRDADGTIQQTVRLQLDGERYRGELAAPRNTGNAWLSISAETAQFIRQYHQPVNILSPISGEVDEGKRQVRLTAEHPRLDSGNTRIEAYLQGETLSVEPTDERHWRIELPVIDSDVSLPLHLTAIITLDGERRELELPALRLNADARTGLGSVRLEHQGLRGESLGNEALVNAGQDSTSADGWSDSLSRIVNTLPQRVQALWSDARPRLQRFVAEHRSDPLAWGLIAAIALLLILLLAWRRSTQRRRSLQREEPNV